MIPKRESPLRKDITVFKEFAWVLDLGSLQSRKCQEPFRLRNKKGKEVTLTAHPSGPK